MRVGRLGIENKTEQAKVEGGEEVEDFKLTIELVPETCWYSNLRSKMSNEDWDRLRRSTYAAYHYKCGICGKGNTQLHCHEIWEYDGKKRIQSLKGFIALCVMCHHVKHIGLAGILANEGKLDFEDVIRHFMKVNSCDEQAFREHYDDAFEIWNRRSAVRWKVDLQQYKSLIEGRER